MPNTSTSARSHRRWWVWWPLLGLGIWLVFLGDGSPNGASDVSLPTRPGSSARAAPPPAAATPRMTSLDGDMLALAPRSRLAPTLVKDAKPSKAARGLFGTQDWAPPPPPPPAAELAPSPVAPTLPYTFIGKKHEGDSWEVYLSRGEQTFIAREGQVLEGSYRIDKIEPPNLTMTYLPLAQVQTIPIGDAR